MATKNVSLYETVASKGAVEIQRVIGQTQYKTRRAMVDPEFDLKLEQVDSGCKKGNPRFFAVHKSVLAVDQQHGPLTEQELADYYSKDEPPEGYPEYWKAIYATPQHKSLRLYYKGLKDGLRLSGESQDDIQVRADGTALEGNTRTVIFREFKKEGDKRFNLVPAAIYPPQVAAVDILGMLTLRHVKQPRRWESSDQVMILVALTEAGVSEEDISKRYGIPKKKLTKLLEAYDRLTEYQSTTMTEAFQAGVEDRYKSPDYRPDKFSIFLKVAGNGTLKKMLYLGNDGLASTAAKDGLGKYDPTLLPRFYRWVRTDKINGRQDVTNMTSTDVGLLRYGWALKVIDTEGGTVAANKVQYQKSLSGTTPGIATGKKAVEEFNNLSGSEIEAIDHDNLTKLMALRVEIDRAIDRLIEGRALDEAA